MRPLGNFEFEFPFNVHKLYWEKKGKTEITLYTEIWGKPEDGGR